MGPDKPVLLYDGDCGFCRRWIERWRGLTGDRIEYAPYQEAGARFPGVPQTEFESSVVLVEAGGKKYHGAEAVFRSLAASSSHRWPLDLYLRVPGVKWAAESLYRLVAGHRAFFSRFT